MHYRVNWEPVFRLFWFFLGLAILLLAGFIVGDSMSWLALAFVGGAGMLASLCFLAALFLDQTIPCLWKSFRDTFLIRVD